MSPDYRTRISVKYECKSKRHFTERKYKYEKDENNRKSRYANRLHTDVHRCKLK